MSISYSFVPNLTENRASFRRTKNEVPAEPALANYLKVPAEPALNYFVGIFRSQPSGVRLPTALTTPARGGSWDCLATPICFSKGLNRGVRGRNRGPRLPGLAPGLRYAQGTLHTAGMCHLFRQGRRLVVSILYWIAALGLIPSRAALNSQTSPRSTAVRFRRMVGL